MLKKTSYALFGFVVLLLLGSGGSWFWWKSAIAPTAPQSNSTKSVTITIEPGTPAQTIGEKLAEAGLIRSTLAWRVWIAHLMIQRRFDFLQYSIQAGTYQFSKQSSLPEIGNKMMRGETVQDRFTIPEGWTQRKMASYFEARGYFSAEAFLSATRNFDRSAFSWLPEDSPHLEGYLYPDTYQIPRDRATPEFIIKLMLEQFKKVALPLYSSEKSSYTFQEWVTLASIVEKETVVAEERSRIAGVFAERLERGMRLAADPTVEYGLNIRQTQEQPLTLKQVNTPSPYNTYLNTGLPPTPIASPGKPALEAALNPPETDYLFFVARYDGTHIFSETFEEHQQARQRIQDKL